MVDIRFRCCDCDVVTETSNLTPFLHIESLDIFPLYVYFFNMLSIVILQMKKNGIKLRGTTGTKLSESHNLPSKVSGVTDADVGDRFTHSFTEVLLY